MSEPELSVDWEDTGHYAHHDPCGTYGANCPACQADSRNRTRYDAMRAALERIAPSPTTPTDTAGAAPAGDGRPATGTAEGRGDDGAQNGYTVDEHVRFLRAEDEGSVMVPFGIAEMMEDGWVVALTSGRTADGQRFVSYHPISRELFEQVDRETMARLMREDTHPPAAKGDDGAQAACSE
jgi:hypothetical protein